MTSYLRPDEKASLTDIESSKRHDEKIKSTIKNVASAGTVGVGGYAASKIAPFLSQFITSDIALKGISKVSPKVGEFLRNGMESGLDLKSGLDFLKQNISKEPAKEDRNIIEQHSPELHSFISDEIKKGTTPLKAAENASKSGKFSKIIDKIQKDQKIGWGKIIQDLYGSGERALPQSKAALQSPEMQEPQGIKQMMQDPNIPFSGQQAKGQQAQPMQQQGQQVGPGQQALMQAIQKLQQARGG